MWNLMWKSFLRNCIHHPGTQLTTVIVLTGTFIIFSLFISFGANIDKMIGMWGDKVQLSVYLKSTVSQEQENNIKASLNNIEGVKDIDFISKKQALKDFLKQVPEFDSDIVNNSEYENPLPSSFEVRLSNKIIAEKQYSILKKASQTIKSLAGVDETSYGKGWLKNYAKLVSSLSTSSWSLLTILLFGSLLIIANSIKNSIMQRREEVEVLEIFGATNMMIRMPFIFEGVILSLFAGILALALSSLLFNWQANLILSELGFFNAENIVFLSVSKIFLILLVSALFGGLGAFLTVIKLNSGWSTASQNTGG